MADSAVLRERIAHLHRRLGFGASPTEIERDVQAGLEATIQRLIDFPIDTEPHPYEFVWREKEEPDLGTWRFRTWWAYILLTTQTPLREKLALFWHSHFAVSDGKVEDGPMMLNYLRNVRQMGPGRFEDLLYTMATEPAMMRYLDMERALRGHPNENFAREIMELFTMGVGNYTETDVKEMSRALTGWGYLNTFWEMPGNTEQKLRDAMRDQRTFATFIEMPTMRDPTPKTILGVTRDWQGKEVVSMLAHRPETAHFIAKKLWKFFGSDQVDERPIERIAETFRRTKGDMRATMRTLVKQPEFWSDANMRNLVKSPADFCVGIARAQGIGTFLTKYRPATAKPEDRVHQLILDQAGYVAWRMERMGQNLMWPEDVSGWKGGRAWLSPAAMAERQQYTGLLTWHDNGVGPGALGPLKYVQSQAPKTPRDVADALCRLYDVDLPAESRDILATKFPDMKVLTDPGWWAGTHENALRLLVASPQMHLA